jgi:hypothetical protein
MTLLFFLLSFTAFAASDSMDAFEKSYPRDNTYCSYQKRRIEILIRGGQKFTEPKERGYGEMIFYREPGKKPKLLSGLRGDTFRLFSGNSPLCSKSHGYKVDDKTLAILFLRENRPFADKLVIQLIDLASLTPKEIIETNYLAERASKTADGFSFKTVPENHNPDFGKVLIESNEFIYREEGFPLWMNYSAKGFEVSLELTYRKFPWKKTFKDQEEFLAITGWNEVDKKFSRTVTYIAINHKLKKRCLLLIESKQKLVGNESWRCYNI